MKVLEAKNDLKAIQSQIDNHLRDEELLSKENLLVKKYRDLGQDEENFYKQKSRASWLNLGNQNMSFFFKMVNQRNRCNRIISIARKDGTRVEDYDELKREVIFYFQ